MYKTKKDTIKYNFILLKIERINLSILSLINIHNPTERCVVIGNSIYIFLMERISDLILDPII